MDWIWIYFNEMNDTLVLVAVPDESGTTGLYFSQN